MRAGIVLSGAALIAAVAAFGGEGKADLSKHPWARFGVGSLVEVRSASEAGDNKAAAVVKTSLIAKDDASATVRIETTAYGNTVHKDQKIAFDAEPRFSSKAKEIGREKIAVEGKEYECRIIEVTAETEGTKTTWRQWVNEALGDLKSVTTTVAGGGATESQMTVAKLSDEIKVGGKPYACRVWEGKTKAATGEQAEKSWICEGVPGGLVRSECKGKVGGVEITVTAEATRIEVK